MPSCTALDADPLDNNLPTVQTVLPVANCINIHSFQVLLLPCGLPQWLFLIASSNL